MTSMNPMLRNTPTVSERIKMNNSGYSLGTVRSLQDQQTMKMRMGAGSLVADNNIFGNLFGKQLNNAQLDLMAARAAGSKSGEQQAIDQGKWLVPLAMRERIVSMNSLENTVGMAPEPGTWKARMKSQPSQPDPFSGGYQPKGKGDPFGPLPPRPRGFAMGGTMGVIPSLADSIRIRGNKISAINQGLAPDNALLMGKQYWQGLDQELAQQRSQGFAEGGTVSNIPKMDSLESVARQRSIKNGDNTNSRSGGANSGFDQWWQEMQKRELESEIAKRIVGHQQMEKDMGLTPLSGKMVGYPKTMLEDAKAGFDQGVTQIGKTAAALSSYIPGNIGRDAEKRRQLYDERGKIIADYRERSPVNRASFITPGGLVNKAVTTIPEVFNPVNKPGMAAKGVNAAWHAARGYLPDKSMKDAAISSLSSILGEKTEDFVTKGKGLVGNTVGALTENAIQYITAPPARARQIPGFSMGGTLDGPGGPTDDMIPAVVDGVEPVRLSDGEEIVDAKTRDFFGKKFFLDLKKKAMKGELEGMQMQKPKEGNVPGFAQGGTLVSPSFAKFEALKNAQSQMPELIPMREQQARDIRLAPMGIEDVGGGRKVLQNRYGTGFSLPDAGAASLISDGSMMRNVGTPTAPRLESIPDPVQGPWGTGGAMPDLGQPERRADIAAQIDQLRSEAPRRRAADIAAAQPMRPQQGTPIPPMMMQASRPTAPSQPFMSPSEKDAAARGSRMERDAAQGRPDGMRETDWQRLRKDPRFLMAQASAKAKATILAKGGRENIPAAKYAPDAAKALMAVKDGGGLDLTELAAIAADNRYDIATRGLAQKHLKRRADQPEAVKPPGVHSIKQSESGLNLIVRTDGSTAIARNDFAPNDDQKVEAFKLRTGKEPKTAEDWDTAYYYAQGKEPTAAGQTAQSFANEAEAIKAGAKGIVMINGRRARID